MKKLAAKIAIAFLSAAALAAGGCRRTDVRDWTVEVPSMTGQNADKIRGILEKFDGVDAKSIKFDFPARTVSLAYDSMKLAKMNIAMDLEKAGFAVGRGLPERKEAAGYIDTRE